ncbi:MAG: amidohydrolase family protein [Dehalococcoidia bacterium]|nr:amidohydrolase family protein [Dehalococcoidia bacterium]
MIIDSHTHIFSPEIIHNRKKYIALDAGFAELYNQPTAHIASAEDLIDSMDNAGIDMSIVCGFAWASTALCHEENNYILEAIARYPQRLFGLVTICPKDGLSALSELERCVHSGAIGLGEMRPSIDSLDSAFDNLWAHIASFLTEHGLLCLFHASEPIGHLYPGKGNFTPEHIYPFITRFPRLKIVLAHWGGGLPFYNLMPEVKKALANTWFDSAASPFLYDPSIYSYVSKLVDVTHILFGSDYPLMPHSRALKDIHTLAISNELKQAILGANADKLLDGLHAK